MATVSICGIPHTIELHENPFDADLHFGQIDYGTATIKLNKNVHPEIQAETLCHEILHGMLVHIGRDDLSDDEQLVTALGNAIYQSFTPRIQHD